VAGAAGKGCLTRNLARTRDPRGFARLEALCDADPHVSAYAANLTLRRSGEIIAAAGGTLADITVGDALELMDREAEIFTCPTRDHKVFYRILRELRIFGNEAPERLRAFRTAGQLTPEELIDRYPLQCHPVRDLLVDYLRERQPAMDWAAIFGSNEDSRSRDTSISTGPASVTSVFGRVPFREFAPLRPTESCLP
jgi:hypothetical protein